MTPSLRFSLSLFVFLSAIFLTSCGILQPSILNNADVSREDLSKKGVLVARFDFINAPDSANHSGHITFVPDGRYSYVISSGGSYYEKVVEVKDGIAAIALKPGTYTIKAINKRTSGRSYRTYKLRAKFEIKAHKISNLGHVAYFHTDRSRYRTAKIQNSDSILTMLRRQNPDAFESFTNDDVLDIGELIPRSSLYTNLAGLADSLTIRKRYTQREDGTTLYYGELGILLYKNDQDELRHLDTGTLSTILSCDSSGLITLCINEHDGQQKVYRFDGESLTSFETDSQYEFIHAFVGEKASLSLITDRFDIHTSTDSGESWTIRTEFNHETRGNSRAKHTRNRTSIYLYHEMPPKIIRYARESGTFSVLTDPDDVSAVERVLLSFPKTLNDLIAVDGLLLYLPNRGNLSNSKLFRLAEGSDEWETIKIDMKGCHSMWAKHLDDRSATLYLECSHGLSHTTIVSHDLGLTWNEHE